MSLRERLGSNGFAPTPTGVAGATTQSGTVAPQQQATAFQELKARLHRELINRMDLTKINLLRREQVDLGQIHAVDQLAV